MAENKKKNSSLLLLLLLLLALIGVSIYAFKEKSNLNELTAVHQELKSEFDAQVAELEKLKNDNAGLQGQLSDKNAELEKLKKQIGQLANKSRLSAKEVVDLTKKIEALNKEIDDYKNRIKELEQQVSVLQAEKQDLTNKNQDLTNQNSDLQGKVDAASQIKAINLSSEFNKKTWFFGTKEKPTLNAEKVTRVALSFFLQNNFLAENGTKEIYMSVMQPNGAVLENKKLESGTREFDRNGEKVQVKYTQKFTTNYNKDLVNKITTTFEPETPLLPGKYEVLVYDGFGNVISDRSAFNFELLGKNAQ